MNLQEGILRRRILLLIVSYLWLVWPSAVLVVAGEQSTTHRKLAVRVDLPLAAIVGGEQVDPEHAYPLFGFSVGQYLCGGTLIHYDILLTAAHCQGVFLDGVYLGGTKIDGSESEVIMVLDEIPHPEFVEETYQNDIMIVKLAWDPKSDKSNHKGAVFQQLGMDKDSVKPGQVAKAIGFGYTEEFGQVSNELREVELDVISNDVCDRTYGTIQEDTMVCTMTESKDTCLVSSSAAARPLIENLLCRGTVGRQWRTTFR